MLVGLCKTCGKKCQSDYCFQHKPRKALKATAAGRGSKTLVTKETYDRAEMIEVFQLLWRIKPHKSEISGIWLGNEISSAFFHHILAKSKYPLAALDPENIIILSIDEHANVENDMYKYEEVNRRRELLKIKYNL